MPPFSVNPNRLDPYKNFKFRVKWDGRTVAGVSRVSALKRSTEVIEYREGGDPSHAHKSPGQTRYAPIILERGITHDLEFENWANLVFDRSGGPGQGMALAKFRKDITIEFLNEAGQLVIAYRVFRCWPSEYQAIPDLDGSANAVAIESLVLQNEGWERDAAVVEPVEPGAPGKKKTRRAS